MQPEIEVKFLNVDFDSLREKLKAAGAVCEQPMRLMRRVMFDYPDNRFQNNEQTQRLRVRDEGHKVALNYKHKTGETNYTNELEVVVSSFEDTIKILEAIGLKQYSFQESRRETWKYEDVEIVLDEWPWLRTYIEIEGPNEQSIQRVAEDLGFNWSNAKFGSVDAVYRAEYPGMSKKESIGDIREVKFDDPVPEFLKKRRVKK